MSQARFVRAAQHDELGQDAGDPAAERVDDGLHGRAPLRTVRFPVGTDHLLVDAPRGLHLDVVVVSEQRLQACLPPGGEQVDAGVQHPPGPVQPITSTTPVAMKVLLDAAPAPVEPITGQPNHVEGIQHGGGVGKLLGGGGLEAGEPVHRDHLHAGAPLLGSTGEPGP